MKLLTLAFLLLGAAARADVREIMSMAEIAPEIRPTTLLVLDIDNTLIEPVGNIGSDQWHDYIVKAYRRDGLDTAAAAAKAGELWTKMLGKVDVKPVEELTPILVHAQQERGLKILALTTRRPADAAGTFAQLKAVGLDLTMSAVRKDDLATERNGFYSRGVFFVGEGPDKGKTLLAFLEQIGLRPTRVVFVGDKLPRVKAVDDALTAVGIPCVSYRYGAADAKVNSFNEVMSEARDKASSEILFHGREAAK